MLNYKRFSFAAAVLGLALSSGVALAQEAGVNYPLIQKQADLEDDAATDQAIIKAYFDVYTTGNQAHFAALWIIDGQKKLPRDVYQSESFKRISERVAIEGGEKFLKPARANGIIPAPANSPDADQEEMSDRQFTAIRNDLLATLSAAAAIDRSDSDIRTVADWAHDTKVILEKSLDPDSFSIISDEEFSSLRLK